MILTINDKWRIASDKRQWILQSKYHREDRGETWRNEAYFVRLEQACAEALERDLRVSDCSTLAEALQRLKSTENALVAALGNACSNVNEVIHDKHI